MKPPLTPEEELEAVYISPEKQLEIYAGYFYAFQTLGHARRVWLYAQDIGLDIPKDILAFYIEKVRKFNDDWKDGQRKSGKNKSKKMIDFFNLHIYVEERRRENISIEDSIHEWAIDYEENAENLLRSYYRFKNKMEAYKKVIKNKKNS